MRLGDVFSSGMVFAANKPIRIFGYGNGVGTVTFDGVSKTVVSEGAFWRVDFPAMNYGGPYELSFESAAESVTLVDIYIGEVYLFSGQSNMEICLSKTNTPEDVYEDNDNIHYLGVATAPHNIRWRVARHEDVGAWSALGYLVGRELAAETGVHIGIILCAAGASVIESWMPEGALDAIGIHLSREEKHLDHYSPMFAGINQDGYLYNNKLCRVIPFSLSGVVWYQGESDASEAEGAVYERELCRMIEVWRGMFENEEMPFAVVQIADCESRIALGAGWRLVQQAQDRISTYFPNTYTIISRDVCETDDIHPRTKDKLAARIANAIKTQF